MRTLPASPDAEKALLGSILLNPDTILADCLESGITADCFHMPNHAAIYRHCVEMWKARNPLDFITLTQFLSDRGQLEANGGAAFITDLFTLIPTAANYRLYMEHVKEKHLARRMISTCSETIQKSHDEQHDIYGVLNHAITCLGEIAAPTNKAKKSFKEMMLDKLDRMERDEPDGNTIKTGLSKLDEHSPLKKGAMPLVTGQRKAGKSTLSLTIAANVLTASHGVLYFSLEDSEHEVIDRLFAGHARIPTVRHSVKCLTEGEMSRVNHAVTDLAQRNMIVRADVYDLDAIVAVSKRAKAENPGIELIVVDYAQLVRANVKNNASREQEVATVSRTLRLLSMELHTALLLLSQLNEDGKSRESRALENDATACWELKLIPDGDGHKQGERILSIPWQRGGEGSIFFPVAFLGHIHRVENHTDRTHDDHHAER